MYPCHSLNWLLGCFNTQVFSTSLSYGLGFGSREKGMNFYLKNHENLLIKFHSFRSWFSLGAGFLLLVEEWRGIGLKRAAVRGCWVEAAVVGAVSQGGLMAVKWTGMRFLCGQSMLTAEKGMGQSGGGLPSCPRGLTHLMLKPWRLLELKLTTPRLINHFLLHFCLEWWYSKCSRSCLNS